MVKDNSGVLCSERTLTVCSGGTGAPNWARSCVWLVYKTGMSTEMNTRRRATSQVVPGYSSQLNFKCLATQVVGWGGVVDTECKSETQSCLFKVLQMHVADSLVVSYLLQQRSVSNQNTP